MRVHEIEAWALRAIERVERCQPNEDSRVELKADWPDDPGKAARQIAGHANALRGEPILWIIGVDEQHGVTGAAQNELADWWSQVKAQFDGPRPELRDLLVDWNGKTTVALYFSTERVPYVVKNPAYGKQGGGPVQMEVPWRDGTAIRSATHSDLIRLLSPLQRPILNIEVGKGRGFLNEYPVPQPVGQITTIVAYELKSDRERPSAPPPSAMYYLRVKVVNRGRRKANDCEGYLAAVDVLHGGEFIETNYADNMRLTWSHDPGSRSLDLLPEVPHWLDVVSTLEHEDRFFLETVPRTTRYADGFDERNTYRLTIRVYAEDAEPAQAFVFLRWHGQWNSLEVFDESEWESRERAFASQ